MTDDNLQKERPWLGHYPLRVSPSYEYPKMNAARFLLDAADKYPRKEALDFLGKSYSYAELLRQCRKMANALKALPIVKGDRVAIMLPNCPQAVIAYYGALMAGAIVVQTNPLYTDRELHAQLADSGARVLVTLDLLMPRVAAARENTQLAHIIVTSLGHGLPFPKSWLYPIKRRKAHPRLKVDYGKNGVVRWRSWLARSKRYADLRRG